jgi:hypothetical protein
VAAQGGDFVDGHHLFIAAAVKRRERPEQGAPIRAMVVGSVSSRRGCGCAGKRTPSAACPVIAAYALCDFAHQPRRGVRQGGCILRPRIPSNFDRQENNVISMS